MANVSIRVLSDVDNIQATGKRITRAPRRMMIIAMTMVKFSRNFLLLKKVGWLGKLAA